jgi:thioredoxin-dependent peroxiredoxin
MVSVDDPDTNKRFAEQEHADFPLLSDPEKKVAAAYGVVALTDPPDRQMAKRFTFYIGPDGKILDIDKGPTGRGVAVRTAGEDTIKKLDALGVKKKSR